MSVDLREEAGGMAVFCKPFPTAAIRYFDRGEVDQAEGWIHTDPFVAQGRESAIAADHFKSSTAPRSGI
jgi:hypothetical protein